MSGRAVLAVLLALAIALLSPGRATVLAEEAAGPQPRVGELNPFVLEVLKAIPADGTHTYWWPKAGEGDYDGVTADLVYRGVKVARGEPEKRTYCCGLTFEVFVRAWEAFAKKKKAAVFTIGGIEAGTLTKVKRDWFCVGDVRDGPVSALVPRKLGVRVEALADARPGDFVQLWRKKGSGHSVVFLGWEKRGDEILALRYWSTQTATKGVGERVERFDGDNGLVREKLYIARAGVAQ